MSRYYFIFLLIVLNFNLNAGNGSSGTGTAMIGNTIEVRGFDGLIELRGDTLVKKDNLKKLIKVIKFSSPPTGTGLVSSKLGSIDGFEFVPNINSSKFNYWIVCEKGNKSKCYRLESLNREDKLVPSILGSLKYSVNNKRD